MSTPFFIFFARITEARTAQRSETHKSVRSTVPFYCAAWNAAAESSLLCLLKYHAVRQAGDYNHHAVHPA